MNVATPGASAPTVKVGAGGVKINWVGIAVGVAVTLLTVWLVSKFVTQEIYDTNGNKTGEVKPRFGLPKMKKQPEA